MEFRQIYFKTVDEKFEDEVWPHNINESLKPQIGEKVMSKKGLVLEVVGVTHYQDTLPAGTSHKIEIQLGKPPLESEADACLDLVREALVQNGMQMEHSPPMFYPEAIHNLFTWGIVAARECLRKHGDQPQEHQVKCISQWIENHQSTKR